MTGEQNRKAKAASRGRDNQTVRLRDTMSDCVVVSLSPLLGVRRGTCASVHIGRRQPGVTLCQVCGPSVRGGLCFTFPWWTLGLAQRHAREPFFFFFLCNLVLECLAQFHCQCHARCRPVRCTVSSPMLPYLYNLNVFEVLICLGTRFLGKLRGRSTSEKMSHLSFICTCFALFFDVILDKLLAFNLHQHKQLFYNVLFLLFFCWKSNNTCS